MALRQRLKLLTAPAGCSTISENRHDFWELMSDHERAALLLSRLLSDDTGVGRLLPD
jgi:hypothetical protein